MRTRWIILAFRLAESPRFALIGVILAVMAHGAFARAAGTAREEAALAFERAERDDAAFDFPRAVAGYEEALRLDPAMPKAIRAQQRAAALRARAEGDFHPLTALERVRRDPKLASDAKAIDELVRQADGFPPGLVRVEARVVSAEAYAHRLDRPADAVPLWRSIVVDPHADRVTAEAAARSLATHLLARKDYAGAEEAVALASAKSDTSLARDVRRAVRRHRLHLAAIGTLLVAIVAATLAIVRSARAGRSSAILPRLRRSGWLIFGYAAYVAVAGALLATGYEKGTSQPFLLFGAVLVPLLALARAWGASGSTTARARGVRAVVCACSALAAAFLVLEGVDVAYLEGLGL